MARRKDDFYQTPAFATMELLDRISVHGSRVLEPCVGDGAIANVLRPQARDVVTADISHRRRADYHADARLPQLYDEVGRDHGRIGWIITNPPFSCAFDILREALQHAELGVALLLRLSFLEPTLDRGEWLAAHPPQRMIVTSRISFTGKGTDSVTTAWMIWPGTLLLSGGVPMLRSCPPIEVLAKARVPAEQATLVDVSV